MGANAINTMAELIAPEVERITEGGVHLENYPILQPID